jgi:23S rRNA (adenine-N6)-dimethyltransferase
VIAIERHPYRLAQLRKRFGDTVIAVNADASDLRLPRRPYHVVANPPFAITTDLLRRLLHTGSRLVTAHLVVQEAAARRWAGESAPGARRWVHEYVVTVGRPVPRHAFTPEPRVNTRVLRIEGIDHRR